MAWVERSVGVYDRYLAARVRRDPSPVPDHVALIITERDLLGPGAFETLERFLAWTMAFDADRVSVYVSVLDPAVIPALRRSLDDVDAPVSMEVRGPDDPAPVTERIQVGIGLGGKHEFAAAVKSLADAVDTGEIAPDEITPADIEDRLVFTDEPDLVIKTGAERLSDFMIWQSVYAELYFTDVNWRNFRRRDYLRALRDYQERKRRFGQ